VTKLKRSNREASDPKDNQTPTKPPQPEFGSPSGIDTDPHTQQCNPTTGAGAHCGEHGLPPHAPSHNQPAHPPPTEEATPHHLVGTPISTSGLGSQPLYPLSKRGGPAPWEPGVTVDSGFYEAPGSIPRRGGGGGRGWAVGGGGRAGGGEVPKEMAEIGTLASFSILVEGGNIWGELWPPGCPYVAEKTDIRPHLWEGGPLAGMFLAWKGECFPLSSQKLHPNLLVMKEPIPPSGEVLTGDPPTERRLLTKVDSKAPHPPAKYHRGKFGGSRRVQKNSRRQQNAGGPQKLRRSSKHPPP